jgi:peroxiredoxin
MKKGILISLLLVASLILVSDGISCSASSIPPEIYSNATPPEIGEQAPNFTVTDISGKTVNLSDFAGDVVLLNFWAVDCDQCNMERDLFEAVHNEYPDIQIMMVNSKDDVGSVKRFIRSFAFNLPVYMDNQMVAADAFDVHLIPKTFLINKSGTIEYIQDGAFSDRAQLEDALASISK